jgi:hypothetical protein
MMIKNQIFKFRETARRQPEIRSRAGVRPKGWTGLGGSFDRLPSLVVLELRGAQVAER